MKKYDWAEDVRLNLEPTDAQLALFYRHKAAGTTPGNPKWYKPQGVRPFVFKAGAAPVLPRMPTGAAWNTAHNKNSVRKGHDLITKYVDGSTLTRRA